MIRRVITLLVGAFMVVSTQAQTEMNAEQITDSVHVSVTPWMRKQQSDPERVRFSWGAEAGSSIDLSGHDMSSFDFNASFGMRYRWLSFVGVGAGANIMVANSCRIYPVFAVIRTDFSPQVNFIFFDLRAGAAISYLNNNVNQTNDYGSAAVGFVLATGKTFRSYLTAGYSYVGLREATVNEQTIPYKPLHLASIRLGITF